MSEALQVPGLNVAVCTTSTSWLIEVEMFVGACHSLSMEDTTQCAQISWTSRSHPHTPHIVELFFTVHLGDGVDETWYIPLILDTVLGTITQNSKGKGLGKGRRAPSV